MREDRLQEETATSHCETGPRKLRLNTRPHLCEEPSKPVDVRAVRASYKQRVDRFRNMSAAGWQPLADPNNVGDNGDRRGFSRVALNGRYVGGAGECEEVEVARQPPLEIHRRDGADVATQRSRVV